MTTCNSFQLHHYPFKRASACDLVVWVLLCCGHMLSTHVHAQFAANPFPLLNDSYTIVLNGIAATDRSGISVSGVGDMNGDGVDDFVVGGYFADPFGVLSDEGQAYLLFGRNTSTWLPNPFELSTLDGTNGVTLNGVVDGDALGWDVAGVHDVNGDGYNDMLIGTQSGDVAYLVFGANGAWPASVSLVQGAFNGVTIVGESGDLTGYTVSGAGDVNSDGVPDICLGVREANTPGGANAGRMSVLYGRTGGAPWLNVLNLTTYVNASTGFSVLGENPGDVCGHAVSGVGDVNGDGVDDVAVGCTGARVQGLDFAGMIAVVFGSSALPTSITPSQLNGTNGFVVHGQRMTDQIGTAISPIGDVNADGLDDFAIGAPSADGNALTNSGEVYVLFGRNASETPWPAEVDVGLLDGTNGFALAGSNIDDDLGQSVCTAGDVNMDGIDDFLVGVPGGGIDSPGLAVLLYGRIVWPAIQSSADLNGSKSVTFEGSAAGYLCGYSVSLLGDVNGDGRGDFGIGCPFANSPRVRAGQTAVLFGPLFAHQPTTASPTTSSPTTGSPTTAAPTTAAPTTAAPTTAAPTTAAPTTASPITASPITASPITASPITASPITASPITASPITTAPTTASPITASPITASPITASPTTAAPTTAAPTTSSPTTAANPTVATTTASPTQSPTVATCATQGAFIPPRATCVNGLLVTTTNTTAPTGSTSTVSTSIAIIGGASFEQPSGSTLAFVAGGGGGDSTSIAAEGGGCAVIGGDAVVRFEADPSNGGVEGNTGMLVLVTADCVIGAFESVTASTAFEGDECVAIGEGEQQATTTSISASFDLGNACNNKSSGLSSGALVGIIVGGFAVVTVIVVVAAKLGKLARERRAEDDVKMSRLKAGRIQ